MRSVALFWGISHVHRGICIDYKRSQGIWIRGADYKDSDYKEYTTSVSHMNLKSAELEYAVSAAQGIACDLEMWGWITRNTQTVSHTCSEKVPT